MLFVLSKKEMALETSAICTNMYQVKDTTGVPIKTLNFEGYSGFNSNLVAKLFELYSSIYKDNSNLNTLSSPIKCYTTIGNYRSNDSKDEVVVFSIISNRHTLFLFSILKSFGINLYEIRMGFQKTSEGILLYVNSKILNLISRLGEHTAQEVIYYLYCLCNILQAIIFSNPKFIPSRTDITSDKTIVNIEEQSLNNIYSCYSQMPETMNIEVNNFSEDVVYSKVGLVNNNISCPDPIPTGANKSSCTYVYNVLKASTGSRLVIINKSLSPIGFYVICKNVKKIYTNMDLRSYSIFDSSEWLPTLISQFRLSTLDTSNMPIEVIYLPTEKLFKSADKEVTIGVDASEFEDMLEKFPDISENYDLNIYSGFFVDTKVVSDTVASSFAEYYKDDAFAQQLYAQNQDYFSTFDLKDLTPVVKGFAKGDVYSMLFVGESGSGKSTSAKVIPFKCDLPWISVNCSVNVEESDLFGTMIPNPEKKDVNDPEFIWKDGIITTAVRKGYACIIEEINFARPGVLGKLNSLLDETRQIDLSNGEIVKAHKNFRLIATGNIGYEGTNRLNKALINRFEVCKEFKDLEHDEAVEVIKSRTGYTDITKINKVYEVYTAIKKYSTEQNIHLVVSIRQLLNVFKQGKYYKTAGDAMFNLLLQQAFIEENEHLEFFCKNILKAFDLSFKI